MDKTLEILVVDDEQGYRDLFAFILEPYGMKVTSVCNGVEAVKKIEEKPYDLILMDVHMPQMTGPEALKKIRTLRPAQKVIIFSSVSDPDRFQEQEAQREGALECLYKPVEEKEIQRVLKKTLGVDF